MKLTPFLRKIKAKSTVKTSKKPLFYTLTTFFLINLVVLVVAALIALGIDVDHCYYHNFFEAFGTGSVKWMVAANSVLSFTQEGCAYNWQLTVLCGVVVGIEMILFSGVIVATVTNALKAYVDKKMSAKGELALEDHIVILNWNNKVPDMIINMCVGNIKSPIIILSPRSKDEILNEINSAIAVSKFRNSKLKINVLIRTGNPLLHSELSDIGVEHCNQIFVMSNDSICKGDSTAITNSDLESLKIVLALNDFNLRAKTKIVVETETFETKQRIDQVISRLGGLKERNIMAVSFNHKLGQILAEAIIEPELAKTYTRLLSYEGSEFYSVPSLSVDEYLDNYTNALPILNLRSLFILAEDKNKLMNKRSEPLKDYQQVKIIEKPFASKFMIFTIGDNQKRKYLLENLEIFKKQSKGNVQYVDCGLIVDDNTINKINEAIGNKDIDCIKILILSNDVTNNESLDSNVFVNLLELYTKVKESPKVNYVTEILDNKNFRSIMRLNIENAIVSNKLISFLLVQMAFNDNASEFFEAMFKVNTLGNKDDFDINVKAANEVLNTKGVKYTSYIDLVRSIYYSSNKKIMPIGLIRLDENKKKQYIYFNEQLDDKIDFEFKADDRLMYVIY